MSTTAIIVVRTVHFAALMALFGGFAFLLFVARPVFDTGAMPTRQRTAFHRQMLRLTAWSLLVALVSGALWLAQQASIVSGRPLGEALSGDVLAAVWHRTQFGEVAQARLVIAALLAALLWLTRSSADSTGWLRLGLGGGVLAGMLAAAVAFAGHAIATAGAERVPHLASDAIHLLAAAAWLGGLLPLYWVLRAVSPDIPAGLAAAQRAASRFSVVGIACVSTLVVTGLVNSWFLVGSVPALVGTSYGRVLLLKIGLFLTMLCLAAINRTRLTPRLTSTVSDHAGPVLWRLKRNILAETGLGLLLLGILAVLGTLAPAPHSQPIWPFPFALSWQAARDSLLVRCAIFAAGGSLAAGLAILVPAVRRRRFGASLAVASCAIVSIAVPMWLLAEPAFPTSFFRSPARYTTLSVAQGIPVYEQNCAACHGEHGHGDGPAAASLPAKPTDLTGMHLFHHGEGTLFWWVSKGIASTPMPPFEDRLTETQRWNVLNFLRAQADAEQSNAMSPEVASRWQVVAPDFDFQIGGQPSETLKEQRGRYVLLVLVGGGEATKRLRQLEAAQTELIAAGIRVVALPMDAAPASPVADRDEPRSPIIADLGPDVASAYTLYRRVPSPIGMTPMPNHIEFLIDRQGYLRLRWIPEFDQGQGWAQLPDLLRRVDALDREPPRRPTPEGHLH